MNKHTKIEKTVGESSFRVYYFLRNANKTQTTTERDSYTHTHTTNTTILLPLPRLYTSRGVTVTDTVTEKKNK